MKLSDLVRLKNSLLEFNPQTARDELEALDGHLTQTLNIPMHINYKDSIGKNISNLDLIEHTLSEIKENIHSQIQEIDREITERTQDYLARGYMIGGYYGSNSSDVPTERNDRILHINDETRSRIIVRLRSYTDWHYPGLEIGPGDGVWTEHMVACDPLYLVDVHKEFIDNTLDKFNHFYRNRLRPYLLKSHTGPESFDLGVLPQNQFGFVFAWNVFNYLPLAETRAYLTSIYNVLRPGGVAMFSYNNCDIPQMVEYVEQGYRSWMPSKLLIDTCKELGFEVITTSSTELTVHWIEIKKPGELKTIKAHQTMGKILNANT
jgi:SAM-dependent methyltransferase